MQHFSWRYHHSTLFEDNHCRLVVIPSVYYPHLVCLHERRSCEFHECFLTPLGSCRGSRIIGCSASSVSICSISWWPSPHLAPSGFHQRLPRTLPCCSRCNFCSWSSRSPYGSHDYTWIALLKLPTLCCLVNLMVSCITSFLRVCALVALVVLV